MRSSSVFIILIFGLCAVHVNGQIKSVSINEFGAKPNDALSDQKAFNAAANFINNRKGNVKLTIPAGKYIVGTSFKYSAATKAQTPVGITTDVMLLIGCSNVTITGTGKVQIKFLDRLPFGTLSNKTGKDSAVHIGSLFRLINCRSVDISNINSDGNNEQFVLLNKWGVGTNPYEREHEGLFIISSESVKVVNCSFNRFGRDGCLILEDPDNNKVSNLSFRNCYFNNNGRNGVSWTGGKDVSFYNCTFSNNCTGIIATNPGAGLDIEPERNALCAGGKFTKCTFSGNGGYAVTSGYTTASGVIFDSCTITGNYSYALYCGSPGFHFTNCQLAGTCMLAYDAEKAANGINFTNCIFTDSLAKQKIHTVNYLAGILGRYIKFYGCTFNSYKVPAIYGEVKKKGRPADEENTYFRNCRFNAYFTKPASFAKNAFLLSNSRFVDCTFKTKGYADFKYVLGEGVRNIYQERSIFKTIK